MNCGHLQSTLFVRVQQIPVEPKVKSTKMHDLSLCGVRKFAETAKTADPSCYAPSSDGGSHERKHTPSRTKQSEYEAGPVVL